MGLLDRLLSRPAPESAIPLLSAAEVGEALGRQVGVTVRTAPGTTEATYADATSGESLVEVRVLSGGRARRNQDRIGQDTLVTWVAPGIYAEPDGTYGAGRGGSTVTLRSLHSRRGGSEQDRLVALLQAAAERVPEQG